MHAGRERAHWLCAGHKEDVICHSRQHQGINSLGADAREWAKRWPAEVGGGGRCPAALLRRLLEQVLEAELLTCNPGDHDLGAHIAAQRKFGGVAQAGCHLRISAAFRFLRFWVVPAIALVSLAATACITVTCNDKKISEMRTTHHLKA